MELITLIADSCGACGMFFFMLAGVLQLRKIIRKKTVRSLSYNTYRSKLAAILFTMTCFGLSHLWLSFSVLTAELIVILATIKLMRKYRGR